jgi:hypothetical protein
VWMSLGSWGRWWWFLRIFLACFRSYVSSSSLSIVFFCFAVRFFGGSCVYLECELLVLGTPCRITKSILGDPTKGY